MQICGHSPNALDVIGKPQLNMFDNNLDKVGWFEVFYMCKNTSSRLILESMWAGQRDHIRPYLVSLWLGVVKSSSNDFHSLALTNVPYVWCVSVHIVISILLPLVNANPWAFSQCVGCHWEAPS